MEKLLRHETSPVTKLIGSWFTLPICLHKTDFERGLIRERVKAGLAAAKKKGIGQDYQSTHLSDLTGLRLSIALAGMSCWRAEASGN
jgi:hypothetical protein